ncbi:unnamed protein product [Tuber aestivum]|uniref:LIM zinc-binding domain-containing protein n=1 Tax=Tuber aestivum TaxID=59557 RepID=A0A292Q5P0_9PEZI|nr:unnamed protein product [Tuber aestivum]
MAGVRESLFSTIKCSLCNADVEISLMGDHACMSAAEESKLDDFPLLKPKPAKGSQAQKPMGHIKIDPFAASMYTTATAWQHSTMEDLQVLTDTQIKQTGPFAAKSAQQAAPPDPEHTRPPHHKTVNHSEHRFITAHSHRTHNPGVIISLGRILQSPFALFKPANVSPVSPCTPPGAAATTSSFYPNCDLYAPVSPLSDGSRAVAVRMNNIAPGPFGVGSGNSSRERTPEMASFAGNPLEKRPGRAPKGRDSETLPAVAASFPDKEEVGARRKRTPTGGHSMDSQTMGRSREAGRESWEHGKEREQRQTSNAERPARPPSRHGRSKSPGGAEARIRRKEHNLPRVPSPPPHSAPRRKGGGSPVDPVSPYTHRSMKSETAPSIPKMNALRLDTRSHTFPVKSDSKSPGGRQPPHPGLGLPRSPSVTVKNHRRNKSSANMAKGLPPPPEDNLPPPLPTKDQPVRRQPSVGVNTMSSGGLDRRSGSKPPTLHRLSPPRADEYSHYSLGNPYNLEPPAGQSTSHIPSPSMSSNASSIFSRNSKSSHSSVSSPPIPETTQVPKLPPKPSRGSRGRSKDSNGLSDIDGLMKELQSSMQGLQPSTVKPKHPIEDRPRDKPRISSHERAAPPPLKPHHPHPRQPSSSASPIDYEKPLPVPDLPLPSPPPPKDKNPRALPPAPSQSPPRTQPPAVEPAPAPIKRRATTLKGNCRGCGKAIVGKSVSSADGRLTGRYHKACFVCKGCREPFQSAEFYVLDNSPYCHRDYHKLNHSLCPSCDRGIEGPCLETATNERFHPNCFRCYDCRCELSGDYFDFNGRPYCERHALRTMRGMQSGSGNGNGNGNENGNLSVNKSPASMERRRTRLAFM